MLLQCNVSVQGRGEIMPAMRLRMFWPYPESPSLSPGRASMTSSIRPLRSLLAAAIVLAAAPAFAQQTYSRTVFFGDSLTDAGYYRPRCRR
jgi:outer membrane lipase/esterase